MCRGHVAAAPAAEVPIGSNGEDEEDLVCRRSAAAAQIQTAVVVVPQAEEAASMTLYRMLISRVYRQAAPSKLRDVDMTLAEWAGREELFKVVCAVCGMDLVKLVAEAARRAVAKTEKRLVEAKAQAVVSQAALDECLRVKSELEAELAAKAAGALAWPPCDNRLLR